MGSNPPIQAVPYTLAQPKVHIARFLESIRPHRQEHEIRGAAYFVRSRRGGDQLSEEDWNPDFVPPSDHATDVTAFLNSLSSTHPAHASTSHHHQLPDTAVRERALADALRSRLRDNVRSVDHEPGQYPFGRGLSALRMSPYPMRGGVNHGASALGGDHYTGSSPPLPTRPPLSAQQERYLSDLIHNRVFFPAAPPPTPLAPLGVEYEATHPLGPSQRTGNVQPPAVSRELPERLAPTQDVVQAAAANRLAHSRPGIFARGVTSQPIKVGGSTQQSFTGFDAHQMDSRVLLGLTSNRAQQQAPPPLPPSQLHYLPSPFGYLRTGTPSPMPFTPWPRCRPYPIQQHVQQHQTPTPLASFPPEEAPLIDAMLPSNASRNRGGDPSYPQQQTPPSALASFLPTDLSNVVSPIDPTSSPFDVFETMHSNAPQASEQRAVSADPPRWDTSAEQHDWARPVSAPPSKLAATPPYEAAQSRIPISTGEPTGPGHQDLFAGYGDAALMGSGTFASQQQPAKPPVESSFGTALRPIYDFDFKWSPFPDAPEWDMSAAATQQHPAPYTYGYSPPAQAEPAGSMLPTLGPSGSSPFPSFQDTRTPHDSPRDETLAAPTYGAHPNI